MIKNEDNIETIIEDNIVNNKLSFLLTQEIVEDWGVISNIFSYYYRIF